MPMRSRDACVVLGIVGLVAGITLIAGYIGIFKRREKKNDEEQEEKAHPAAKGGKIQPEFLIVADGDDVGDASPAAEVDVENVKPASLNVAEARMLTRMLSTADEAMLQKVLVTIGNSAAFTINQDLLREVGCLQRLVYLLRAHGMALKVGQSVAYPAVVNTMLQTVNNLAMNCNNQNQLQDCIPTLIDFASAEGKADESVKLASLQALTNLSVTRDYHLPYTELIQQLYEHLDAGTPRLQLQALRVLANLSANPDMVPHLLAAKAPRCLFGLLVPDVNPELLLRWMTVLANMMLTVREQNITSATLPTEFKAPSPETMYTAIYGLNTCSKLKSKVFVLSRHHNEDIRHQATRVHGCLT